MSLKQRLQQLGFSVVSARAAGEVGGNPKLKDIEAYPPSFTANGIKFNHERGEEHLAEYHGFWHDKLVFVLFNEHPSGSILVSVGFDKDGNEDGYAEEFPLKHDMHFDDALRRITSAVKARIEVFEDDGL